jgi:hypothetical protein
MKIVGCYLALVSGGVVTMLALFLVLGRTTPNAVAPATMVAVGMAVYAWKAQSRQPSDPGRGKRPGSAGWFMLALGALFTLRTGLWLAWEYGDTLRVGSPNNIGDFCLHLTHVRQLAGESAFWPVNPIAADSPLTYPIGIALWHVLLLGYGMPILGVFALATVLGLGAGIWAAWRWGGAFGLAALLCNGGILGWALFRTGLWADYQAEVAWKSIPLAILVTQRGFLYALPAGLWLLSRWRHTLVRGKPGLNGLDVWIYATLPLFHLHTFLALSFFLGVWWLAGMQRTRILRYGLAAMPVATGLVWLCTGGFRSTGGLGWAWGWFAREGETALDAMWVNFGLWLGLLPALGLWLVWRRGWGAQGSPPVREAAAWVWPGLVLLGFSLAWKLQPWAWDNTKLMLWGWLALAPALWQLWLRHWPKLVLWPLCGALFASGLISLIGGMGAGLPGGYAVADRLELAAARELRAQLPSGAVVAAAPTYNQPLLLAGQPIAVGYDGHLWSHGSDYGERRILLDRLLNGAPGWREAARTLGVGYLFWGALENEAYPDSARPWQGTVPVEAANEAGTVFRLMPQ